MGRPPQRIQRERKMMHEPPTNAYMSRKTIAQKRQPAFHKMPSNLVPRL